MGKPVCTYKHVGKKEPAGRLTAAPAEVRTGRYTSARPSGMFAVRHITASPAGAKQIGHIAAAPAGTASCRIAGRGADR